ncbi:MAG: ThiF family adenylyltransferase [Porticoccaceae bacterium]
MEFIADYSRQLSLSSMTESKQSLIVQSKVLIFGAGGLGVTAISYLAGAGVGTITIVDYDRIEASNLHRQTIYQVSDIGDFKAQVAVTYLKQRSPDCDIAAITDHMDLPSLCQLCQQFDVILDCTDDQPFSYLLNAICLVEGKKVVFANAVKLEGQLFILDPDNNQPCFNCLWPETESVAESCNQLGVLGPVPGILGCLQALEAIKIIINEKSHLLGHLLHCDFITYEFSKISIPKSDNCDHQLSHLDLERAFKRYQSQSVPRLYDLSLEDNIVIDIRSTDELSLQPSGFSARHIEAQQLVANPQDFLDKQQCYLLVCSSGKRSIDLCNTLQKQGYRTNACRLGPG